MASWADEANGDASVDQENFKAERIISQSQDGREKVRQQWLSIIQQRRLVAQKAKRALRVDAAALTRVVGLTPFILLCS